ncbi:hypothetical protein [Gellertiella hungarica]|uniref:Uncharacterized protein n=1 Tax=Gellertiella hungarica TaxID=1572859 RepID=A0A7W6J4Q7_9HYPH|nr:hypothetical protein [Gellertiella hungarica]MBB4064753.1 hypothetical protein [Gellertiella hungarica]
MNTIGRQLARFEGWERDDRIAEGTRSTWTNFLMIENDDIDMLIIGETDSEGPTHFSVTGSRGKDAVTFAEGTVSSWNEACRRAETEARRALMRPVE